MIFAEFMEKHHVRMGLRENFNNVWDVEKHTIFEQDEENYINFARDKAKQVICVWNEEKHFIFAWHQVNILLVRCIDANTSFQSRNRIQHRFCVESEPIIVFVRQQGKNIVFVWDEDTCELKTKKQNFICAYDQEKTPWDQVNVRPVST